MKKSKRKKWRKNEEENELKIKQNPNKVSSLKYNFLFVEVLNWSRPLSLIYEKAVTSLSEGLSNWSTWRTNGMNAWTSKLLSDWFSD